MSGTLKLNDTLFATEDSGVISVTTHSTETNVVQNSNVITQSLTIANNKNATISAVSYTHLTLPTTD